MCTWLTLTLKQCVNATGENSKEAAIIRVSIGEVFLSIGEYDKAAEQFYHSIIISDGLKFEEYFVPWLKIMLSLVYMRDFKLKEAHDTLSEVREFMDTSKDMGTAISFSFFSYYLHKLNTSLKTGDMDEFLDAETFDFYKSIVPDDSYVAIVWEDIPDINALQIWHEYCAAQGSLSLREEDYETAIIWYELVAMSLIELYGMDTVHAIEIAIMFDNIGVTFAKMGKYDKAIEYSEISNDIFTKFYNNRNIHSAKSHMNLAIVKLIVNDNSAVEHAQIAVDIFKYFYGEKSDELAVAYDILACCYYATGNIDRVEQYFEESIDSYINHYCIDKAITYVNYTKFLILQDKIEKAITNIHKAKTILNVITNEKNSTFRDTTALLIMLNNDPDLAKFYVLNSDFAEWGLHSDLVFEENSLFSNSTFSDK